MTTDDLTSYELRNGTRYFSSVDRHKKIYVAQTASARLAEVKIVNGKWCACRCHGITGEDINEPIKPFLTTSYIYYNV